MGYSIWYSTGDSRGNPTRYSFGILQVFYLAYVRYTGVIVDRRSSIRYSTGNSRWYPMYMYVISGDQ